MSEWHLTPDYINEYWTEELLLLMFQARRTRLERLRAMQRVPMRQEATREKTVPDFVLFGKSGIGKA